MYLNQKKLEKEISKKKKHDKSGGEELPIIDDDTRSKQQWYLHWQQSRPKLENQNRNMFSKISFEMIATFINAHLKIQSDRNSFNKNVRTRFSSSVFTPCHCW